MINIMLFLQYWLYLQIFTKYLSFRWWVWNLITLNFKQSAQAEQPSWCSQRYRQRDSVLCALHVTVMDVLDNLQKMPSWNIYLIRLTAREICFNYTCQLVALWISHEKARTFWNFLRKSKKTKMTGVELSVLWSNSSQMLTLISSIFYVVNFGYFSEML